MDNFLAQVLETVHALGGLPWAGKIASVVLLIIAAFKVSVLNDLVWSKLGAFKAVAAPVLGLVAGVLMLSVSPGGITVAGLLAYVGAGAGAVLLHELLDMVKAIPGIGPLWVTVIGVIEGALGGQAQSITISVPDGPTPPQSGS